MESTSNRCSSLKKFAIAVLKEMGLLFFVPHLHENSSSQSEMLHPYGVGQKGEEPIEREIGAAANAAAREMGERQICFAETEGFDHFCPVLKTLPEVQMIGVARLRYRPRTSRTAAWWGQLQDSGQVWINKYRDLAGQTQVETSKSVNGFQGQSKSIDWSK